MGLDLNTCTVAGCSKAAIGVGAWLGLPLVIENTEYEFRQTRLSARRVHAGRQPMCRSFFIVGGFYSEVALQKREAEGTVRTKHQLNLDPNPEGAQKNLDDRRYGGREEQRIPRRRHPTGYVRASLGPPPPPPPPPPPSPPPPPPHARPRGRWRFFLLLVGFIR